MGVDLQKASIWKRIAAWFLDLILVAMLAVGCGALFSVILGYNDYNQTLDSGCAAYEAQYGVTFDITQEAYLGMSEQTRQNYDKAYEALVADEAVVYAYNMMVNLSVLITTLSLLVSMMILEFVVPLLLKNGQTIGKKAFGIGLVRSDCVKVSTLQLFVRALFGKYTIGAMIPVYIALMVFWGILNFSGTVMLFGLALAQLICVGVTRNNCGIHDLMAGTAAVDLACQKVFQNREDMLNYVKRIHAERAARQDY